MRVNGWRGIGGARACLFFFLEPAVFALAPPRWGGFWGFEAMGIGDWGW